MHEKIRTTFAEHAYRWLITVSIAIVCAFPAGAGPTVNYDTLDEILVQNVRNGFVDYDGIAADPRLDSFIAMLGDANEDVLESGNDKLAFYINAYNALAIQGILAGQSPSSTWKRYKYFKRLKFPILGQPTSLYALEHDRIIPMGDPRIHFAIVCASISCPRLASHAYIPDTVNQQLHDAARQFINDPTRNRFDLETKIAFVSKIFEWYAEDFESAGGSLQSYLARFADDAAVQDALRRGEFDLRYLDYDWNLNGHYSGAGR
jgi:hypothetical protein